MILRTIKCDIPQCNAQCTEPAPHEGWKGWGQLSGVTLNETPNPYLCPNHLAAVAGFVDTLEGEQSGVD